MGCDERSRIAFLAGCLPLPDARRFDAHLLSCESCWEAVQQDRRGREALESLWEAPPPTLSDRVRLAVETEVVDVPVALPGRRPRPGPRWHLAAAVVTMLVLVLVLVAGGVARLAGDPPARDPAVVAAVVRFARHAVPSPPHSSGVSDSNRASIPAGTREVGGHQFSLARYQIEGHDLVVATSARPFPMPAGARALAAGEDAPWVARRGDLGVACFSRPVPLLVAGRLPPDEVAALGARLQLH